MCVWTIELSGFCQIACGCVLFVFQHSSHDSSDFRHRARPRLNLKPHLILNRSGESVEFAAESNTCTACQDSENILHLAECPVIKQEFWEVIIATLRKMGMKEPQHSPAFITLGRIDKDTVVDKYMAEVMFLAWRCLYAELTRARIDKGSPDLQAALRRTGNT